MRTVLLAAGFALLATSAPQPAGAEERQDPAAAAQAQVQVCDAAGGKGTVEEVDRTVDGVSFTSVRCTGGMLDGMYCDNGFLGSYCRNLNVDRETDAGSQWPVLEVVQVLETGSVDEYHQLLAELEAANAGDQDLAPAANDPSPVAQPSVARGDDRDHDQDSNKRKGKKSKHGKKSKKGGKGRK